MVGIAASFYLRPHHGLCVAFFEGKGYNQKFTENMGNIVESLENSSLIQLVESEDSICACCPNNKQSGCIYSDKVLRYDNAVLDICNFSAQQVLTWKQFSDLVNSRIIKENKLDDICGDCEWKSICKSKAVQKADSKTPPTD